MMPESEFKKNDRELELRNYRPGDENEICTLFERVFGKPMGATESARHWHWEYAANPVKGTFIKLAWDKEQLVGQYAASPVRVFVDGRDIIGALSHDTMTDPQYVGLGIFRNAAKALYADEEKAGHCFIYGFPNCNSIQGFTKSLNWYKIMPAPVHIRPIGITTHILRHLCTRAKHPLVLALQPTLAHKAPLSLSRSSVCELHVESEFGNWADDLWRRCLKQHRLWVIRDKAYLNWRYIDRPESKYSIVSAWRGTCPVGYVITALINKNFGPTLFVLDFMVDLNFNNVAEMLIRYVVKLAKYSGAAFASALLTPGSRYRYLFRHHLFMQVPERLFPQPLYFGARCFDPALKNVVFDPGAWSISWGDNDVL